MSSKNPSPKPLLNPTLKWLLYALLGLAALAIGAGYADEFSDSDDAQRQAPAAIMNDNMPVVASRFQAQPDFTSQFNVVKRQWVKGHPGQAMSLPVYAQLADSAFKAGGEQAEFLAPLTSWALMTPDSHPWVLVPQVMVENTTQDTAWLNMSVTAQLDSHIGPWLVDSELYLTDRVTMAEEGQWYRLESKQWFQPVMAPQQTFKWSLSPVNIASAIAGVMGQDVELAQQPSHWLDELRLTVTVNHAELSQPITEITTLTLQPDMFAVPFWQSP